jgi:SAM-dependent methyltransferase
MLYDLVTLKKTLLETYNTQEVEDSIRSLRTHIENVRLQVPVIEQENLDYIEGLVQYYSTLLEQVSAPNEDFKRKIREIDDKIAKVSHDLFVNNYELEENDGGPEHVRNHRRIHLRPEVEEMVKYRIQLYTGWQYPALEIGCRDGEWTQYLVAADPLYIMDKHQEFLDSANSKFPQEYQGRLRKYLNKEYDFKELPQEQFGFIFSWGHFNYVSLDTITQVLKAVKTLLRPGGVFLFSYNDGDTPAGAGMAENFAQSYMPKSVIVPLCLSLGFDVVADSSFSTNISWLEIKRPGQLTTVKAHQVLGEIKHWNALG